MHLNSACFAREKLRMKSRGSDFQANLRNGLSDAEAHNCGEGFRTSACGVAGLGEAGVSGQALDTVD